MSKKRKVRWIVSGVLGFVVPLFFVASFMVSENSPNAKLDRALSQILVEYDFEYTGDRYDAVSELTGREALVRWDTYSSGALGQEDRERIDAIILEACPTGTIDSGPPLSFCYLDSFIRGASETQRYLPEGMEIHEISFEFNNKDRDEEGLRSSTLIIRRDTSASPLSFLKTLWPW